jgi:tripartite-type tricarboxylate transporter receptor subunit TctC
MRNVRANILLFLAAAVAGDGLAVGEAAAQAYPNKPIRIIAGFGPGGSTDVIARLVAQKLSESLGQQVIVENRPGASTAIAAERVATSPPDGYTLLLAAASTTIQSALRKNLPYDLERGFAHVSLVAIGPFVLVVHPSLPVRGVKELIALARSQPGKLNYGSPGTGSVNHLTGELFKLGAKVDIVHVPYKGSAESSVANAAGEIALSFPSIPAALPLLEARRLRALAVTSIKRVSVLPSVPTLDETALPGFNYAGALGLCVPAAVPKEIVTRLNAAIVKVVNTAEMRESIAKQGFEAQASTPEQYTALIHSDLVKLSKLIEITGMKAD